MSSKTLIQIILIIVVLLISSFFYNQYFYKKNTKNIKKENIENLEITKKKDLSGNIIKDIIYKSTDENDNVYIIKSEYGELNQDNSDIILMTNVSAIINLNDGSSVNMRSKNAKYNITNYDTNFFNSVELIFLDHKITADNIDVYFKDSKLEAYNNLVYRNLDLRLIADKIEVNLIEKSSKIFMFNDEKVEIIKSK